MDFSIIKCERFRFQCSKFEQKKKRKKKEEMILRNSIFVKNYIRRKFLIRLRRKYYKFFFVFLRENL